MKIHKQNIFLIVIKCLVAVLSFAFIFFKMKQGSSFSFFEIFLETFTSTKVKFLLFVVFFLFLINWLIEALKWKIVINKLELFSFKKAVKSVFSGMAVGFITPNRIGEFAGKVLFLQPENRVKGIVLNGVVSFSQLLFTLLFGALAVLFYKNNLLYFVDAGLLQSLLLFTIVVIFLCFAFLFNVKWVFKLLLKIKILDKYKDQFTVYQILSNADVLKVIALSLFRYITFLIQYLLVFYMFNLNCNVFVFFALTAFYFLLITAIPTFFITEIGVRGSAAILVFGSVFPSTDLILSAILLVWIVNLALPAILGVVFLFRYKYKT